MSLWHSPHAAESMKKFAGMMPPTFVCAEDGKNGECGPPPSADIESGAVDGFTMRAPGDGCALEYSVTPIGNTTSHAAATPNAHDQRRAPERSRQARHATGTSAATAAAPAIT